MLVQRLGVEETALAVASAEGGRGAPSILGVAAASTSTVVPLGRLRRAAGAHLLRVLLPARVGAGDAALEMQEAAPPVRGRRAAAATGCLDKAAARSAGLLSNSRPRSSHGRAEFGCRRGQVLSCSFATDICSWSCVEAGRGRGREDSPYGASP